ncbi:tubulin-folding cofactor B [Coturnix japonica]|uniref:tubulin-folding cofactor B n=1 Tax=Coturnix japonica TaxID=93934 RepID=UPI0013A5E53D|nr:tubulin-folding cofactor B [Coturnix japonica]
MKAMAEPGPGLVGTGSVPPGSVSLSVSSNLSAFTSLRRYGTELSVAEIKRKLELVVGVSAPWMELELRGAGGEFLARLEPDDALLGSFPVSDGCGLHVGPIVPNVTPMIPNVPHVPFPAVLIQLLTPHSAPMSPNGDSVRSFLRRRRWGRFDEDAERQRGAEAEQRRAEEAELAAAMTPGSRCLVSVPGQPQHRGTIAYVGLTDFKPGHWVGVRYDEPVGKHDGSVGGRRYFECPHPYGAFVRPQRVTVGDYPEEDDGLDEL